MHALAKPIAAVQGGTTPQIQAVFRAFLASLQPHGRVAGVIEESPTASDADDGDAWLRNLVDGRVFPLFQDLGPNSTACGLDAGSVVSACEAVRRDIAAGCDLVVLSKFGRLEAERSGLADAFAAAVEVQAPVLTSVSPKFAAPWAAFAAPLFVVLPPQLHALQAWWRSVSPRSPAPPAEAAVPDLPAGLPERWP
jgi:hypothetical protein